MMKKISGLKKIGMRWLSVACLALAASFAQAQFNPFGGGGAFGGGGGGGGGGARANQTGGGQPIGGADISYDPETRRLIVVTDDKTVGQIREVVAGLDRPSPQVLIKVVFLEATYNKDTDIGIAGAYGSANPNNGTTGILGQAFGIAPTTVLGSLTSQASPGSGIYSILGSDFQATLRAIATAGKTEVLSRPSILARNNQAASISLGQQVPLITNTRFDALGNQVNTVSYQNVGIGLTVTPFITTDGNVEMVITPEISGLADRSQWVPISSGTNSPVSAPVINSRTATTTVVVPNGQTVIIGGLMENTITESVSKVPGLGDIPLLGALFTRKVKGNAKRELIIFLTPHVVAHPAMLAGLTTMEKANKELTPKAFSEQELNRFLDNLPAKDPVPPAKNNVAPPKQLQR